MELLFILLASIVTFLVVRSFLFGVPPHILRRLFHGWKLITINIIIHTAVMYVAMDKSSAFFLQAEIATLLFSAWMLWYRKAFGYEVWSKDEKQYIRYSGIFTRHV
jgi:hypothetical protein